MIVRPRRLRTSPTLRDLVSETTLNINSFIYPMFVVNGKEKREAIPSMPGIFRYSIDELLIEVEELIELGLNKLLLFGVGEDKSEDAVNAWNKDGVVQNAIHALKAKYGSDIYLITDVCLCAYTNHGHCGILHNSEILNDESLEPLSAMALSHAMAGADMVAPSDMMDGRISALRGRLDSKGFSNIPIMSYSVKYASAYYGPFRDAAESAPGNGDRKTYQMDFRNVKEALKEARLDIEEGADILMVKPALAYLDVIKSLKDNFSVPVACYNVSGEYSMVKAAAENGWIDEQKVVIENMYAFVRSGADIIITYHAKDILKNNWI